MKDQWLSTLQTHAALHTLSGDFARFVGSGPTVNQVVAWISDRGFSAALIYSIQLLQAFTPVDELSDRAGDLAIEVISSLVDRLKSKGLVALPRGPLAAYLRGSVKGARNAARRIDVPTEILSESRAARLLFMYVVVERMDPITATALVAQEFPAEADRVEGELLTLVQSFLDHDRMPKSVIRRQGAVAFDPDIMEQTPAGHGVAGSGYRDPSEQFLRSYDRAAIAAAVERLAEPDRTLITAWYLEERFTSQQELGAHYGIADPKYALRKARGNLRKILERHFSRHGDRAGHT